MILHFAKQIKKKKKYIYISEWGKWMNKPKTPKRLLWRTIYQAAITDFKGVPSPTPAHVLHILPCLTTSCCICKVNVSHFNSITSTHSRADTAKETRRSQWAPLYVRVEVNATFAVITESESQEWISWDHNAAKSLSQKDTRGFLSYQASCVAPVCFHETQASETDSMSRSENICPKVIGRLKQIKWKHANEQKSTQMHSQVSDIMSDLFFLHLTPTIDQWVIKLLIQKKHNLSRSSPSTECKHLT